MATTPALEDGVSDLDRVEQALTASRMFFAACDTADTARDLREGEPAYSPIRSLCELGEQAFARIRVQLDTTPCIPPTAEPDGGGGSN